ncbi:hypothetical protein [Brachybacterium sp. UNK5269]|uniref:hypothetical protein n=1 Tax=Brachybacterium sp. UNK5269 TaxID=3408576 RepID=UPI003BB20BCC
MSTAEPAQTPEPGQAPEPAAGPEPVTALAAAVALLALAGIGALLADHLLSGALRLAAGALAGAGLGAAALAVTGARGRPRRSLAAAVAGAAALALTVPAVLATRPPALADLAAVRIAALAEGDRVHSLPDPAAPVLVRRAAGDAELLDATGVRRLDAAPADLVALSADGARLVHVRDGATTVLPADSAGAPPPPGPTRP